MDRRRRRLRKTKGELRALDWMGGGVRIYWGQEEEEEIKKD